MDLHLAEQGWTVRIRWDFAPSKQKGRAMDLLETGMQPLGTRKEVEQGRQIESDVMQRHNHKESRLKMLRRIDG